MDREQGGGRIGRQGDRWGLGMKLDGRGREGQMRVDGWTAGWMGR